MLQTRRAGRIAPRLSFFWNVDALRNDSRFWVPFVVSLSNHERTIRH